MKKKIVILICCGILQACSQVDDYMLGKDNTPKPKVLKPLESKVKVAKNWTVSAGGAHTINSYSKRKPVVLGNTVYTADSAGLVQAVNVSDAKVRWSTTLTQGIVSGPVVGEGVIALGTADSKLVVVDQATGKELWMANVTGEMLANPVIAKQVIIVKTINGNVYAFDRIKGEKLWFADHGAPELVLKASSSPVVMGNLLLVGFSDGKLDAFDIKTGALNWQRSIVYASGSSDVERLVDIDADPIIQGQVAYLASYQGYLGALSLTDGQFIWRKPASVYKNMTLGANTLYLTDSNDVLWAINKTNGHVNWKQTALKARGLTEPVLMGHHLIVGDNTGLIHVIASQTGELLARSQLSGAIDVAPVVEKGKLYVQTANGMLNQMSVG